MGWPGKLRRRIALALLVLLALSLLLIAPRSQAAEGAYEPNDAAPSAAGPLLAGSTYTAGVERQDDRDFFFFHVTSPSASQATLTLTNLGGGGSISDLNFTILDSTATPVVGEAYIRAGESRTVSVSLKPQKYYVEVVGGKSSGDSYNLVPGGAAGAFGPYTEIAARCASATTEAAASETRLSGDEAKLQRTIARVRRARYSTPTARKRARAAYRRARARLRSERRALGATTQRRELWCSIAP